MSQFLVESTESWIVLCQEEMIKARNQPKPYGYKMLGFPPSQGREGQGRVLADVENLSFAHKMQIIASDQLLAVKIPNPRQEEIKDEHSGIWLDADGPSWDWQMPGLIIFIPLQKTPRSCCQQNRGRRRHFGRCTLKMSLKNWKVQSRWSCSEVCYRDWLHLKLSYTPHSFLRPI